MSNVRLHCPWCGDPLVETADGLTCLAGNMELSENMRQALTTAFGPGGATDNTPWQRYMPGGAWFCPACGTPMETADYSVNCHRCGRTLNRYIYQLVERHPHADVAPGQGG